MFSILNIFSIKVEETPGSKFVTLSNIQSNNLRRDFVKTLGSPLIEKYMLHKATYNKFVIHKFFIPDLYYILTKILLTKGHIYTTRSHIKDLLKQIELHTWYKSAFEPPKSVPLNLSRLSELSRPLLPIQLEALKEYNLKIPKLKLRGFLLDAATGSGKSGMLLAMGLCSEAKFKVIICPKHTISKVWVDEELPKSFGKKNKLKVFRSDEQDEIVPGYDWYFIHYEAIGKLLQFFHKHKYPSVFIGIDECHNLNELGSMRTNIYIECCEASNAQNIVPASGTPLKALGREVVPLLQVTDPLFDDYAKDRFLKIYSRSAGSAAHILQNRISLVSHTIPKSAIMGSEKPIEKTISITLPDSDKYTLPFLKIECKKFFIDKMTKYDKEMDVHEKLFISVIRDHERTLKSKEDLHEFNVYLDYINKIKKGYDPITMGFMSIYCNTYEKTKIIPNLPKDIKDKFIKSKSVVKYVKMVVMGEWLAEIGRKRVELHKELIRHAGLDEIVKNAEKKTICFSNYVDAIKEGERYFKEAGFNPLCVYGDTNADLGNIIDKFKSDKTVNPLLATIQSMSTGITLIVANIIIFFNLPFRDYEMEQAIARAFRLGQDTQVYVYKLLLNTKEANLATRLEEILEWSRSSVYDLMGHTNNEMTKDEDIFITAINDNNNISSDEIKKLAHKVAANENYEFNTNAHYYQNKSFYNLMLKLRA